MSFKDKLKTLLSLPTGTETRQFEEDVNWCIEEISHHFSALPYWEEFYTANFCRHDNNDAAYWAKVNKEATKRLTDTVITLPHQEAYRELNRMTLFAINVMVGALLDSRYNSSINKKLLEEVLEITHESLSVRAPNSLSKHDDVLQSIQTCIDRFCESIAEPSDDFTDFADKMNKLRLKDKQN
ncbi:hypothetical protein ACPV5O_24260 [Vibrio maritimus]|uniref:hypothetical protein n=1 Tax=Vibrio maritimus TaxID=990268 RepID=UPI0040689857